MDSSSKELDLIQAEIPSLMNKMANWISLPLPYSCFPCRTTKSERINTTAPATRQVSVQESSQQQANLRISSLVFTWTQKWRSHNIGPSKEQPLYVNWIIDIYPLFYWSILSATRADKIYWVMNPDNLFIYPGKWLKSMWSRYPSSLRLSNCSSASPASWPSSWRPIARRLTPEALTISKRANVSSTRLCRQKRRSTTTPSTDSTKTKKYLFSYQKVRIIIQMASTNGVIPAGSVSFNPCNK